jgi:hypothetical protein
MASTDAAIMTDIANAYPVNKNDWFIVKYVNNTINPIVSFRHKYQTTTGRDGGIVEFSKDNGLNWENIRGECNNDSGDKDFPAVVTDNFYTSSDTLVDGTPAFSGTSNWKLSRLQFFTAIPLKTTGPSCVNMDTVWLRFRFISDDTVEAMDGWIIDDIKIEKDMYSAIKNVTVDVLKIYPNPTTGIINFPSLRNQDRYSIEVTNTLGQPVLRVAYQKEIDLSSQPKGLYFYKVSGEDKQYTGRVLLQ